MSFDLVKPVDTPLALAKRLKQSLLEFVLDAEGDLAIALESYSAEHLARAKSQYQGTAQTDLIVDSFLSQGCIGDKTPIDLFLEHQTDLDQKDLDLLALWRQSFTGLFAVTQVFEDGFELKNWLTQKYYRVGVAGLQSPEQIARLKSEEIVLTRIAPVTEDKWILFSALILLGKLGRPKLAVAIGNFKKQHPEDLYADAPDLLQEAWRSVERSHQEWLEFFGSDEVTLSGYEANQQLKQFQESLGQRRLAAAGMDGTQSLSELASQSGVSKADIAEATQTLEMDGDAVEQLLQSKPEVPQKPAMVTPQISLPEALIKAEQVTLLTHAQWGQMYLSSYPQLKVLLQGESVPTEKDKQIVRRALESAEMNAYLWHRLADQYFEPLERLLQTVLDQPNFRLRQGLDALLQSFGKPLKPVLPETASVPAHLHHLFQEAVLEVHKTQAKSKPKINKGFQRQ